MADRHKAEHRDDYIKYKLNNTPIKNQRLSHWIFKKVTSNYMLS